MKKLFIGIIAAGSALAFASPVSATITISLQYNNGAVTQVATDVNGVAAFNGTFGNAGVGCNSTGANCYSILTTAQGFPLLAQPSLQTTSLQARSSNGSAAGTLTVLITQTGLSPIAANFTSGLTNNNQSGSAISAQLTTLLGNAGLANQVFTANGSSSLTSFSNQAGTFSETARYVLTFGAGAGSFNDTININATAVPEPATWGLMLLGFGGVASLLRLRRENTPRIRFA